MNAIQQHERDDCDRIGLLLDTYLDGELTQELRFEVDRGLAQCLRCREHVQLLQAMRTSMKRVTEQDGVVSAALAERIHQSVAAERERRPARTRSPYGWKWALPTAAAAAALGFVMVRGDGGQALFGRTGSMHSDLLATTEKEAAAALERDAARGVLTMARDDSRGPGPEPGSRSANTLDALLLDAEDATVARRTLGQGEPLRWGKGDPGGWPATQPSTTAPEDATVAASEVTQGSSLERASAEAVLDKLIDYHSSPRQPQLAKRDLVRQLERRLGVHINLPQLEALGARWRSGSLVPVDGDSRAASLHYDVAKHRMTIYVYDPKVVSVNPTLKPRVVANFPVYVGYRRGYSVASFERRGVGYTLATDLDDGKVTEIATTFR